MSKYKDRFDNLFHNLPDAELADEFGDVASADARRKALRKELIRRGLTHVIGERFELSVQRRQRTVFNHQKCIEALGTEAYDALWERTDCTWVVVNQLKKGGS